MNRCEVIRELMQKTGRPMTPGEVIAALPQYSAAQVRDSIHLMYHHAVPPILDREGNKSDGFAYFVARSVQIKAYPTDEARREATLRRERIRHRRKRGGGSLEELRAKQAAARALKAGTRHRPPSKAHQRPLAEYRAEQAEKREQKARARAEAARLRAEKRAAEREATRRAVEAKAEAAKRERAQQRAKRRLTPAQRILAHDPPIPSKRLEAPPVRLVRTETVAEWMARTGQRPEVLPAVWNQHREAA